MAATCQDGAYDLTVLNPGIAATRKAGAIFFLPTDADWVKAAYHDSTQDWLFPTRSNTPPTPATCNATGDISPPGPGIANYNNACDWNTLDGNVSTVGSAGPASATFYGTFDQGGNVSEWVEDLLAGKRVGRGGSYSDTSTALRSATPDLKDYFVEASNRGFRIARAVTCPDADLDGQPDLVGEVHSLSVTKIPTNLVWLAEPRSLRYDVVSGQFSQFATLGTTGATCLANDVLVTTTADGRPNPTLGNGYFYLVRGQNACGSGTYGRTKSGLSRLPAAGCP